MIKYKIIERDTKRFIDDFESLEDAQNAIKQYEELDKEEGNFITDLYEIEENETCEINLQFDKTKIINKIKKSIKTLKKLQRIVELLK